jgi:predicted MFS family arabinose efflux permease
MAFDWELRKRELFISGIFFLTMFGYDLVSPFMMIFMKGRGLDIAQAGLAYGMLPLVTIFLAGVVGYASDRIGRIRLLTLGVFLFCAFVLISSVSTTLTMFILAYIVLGVGNSLFWVCGRSYTLDIGPGALKYFYFAMLTGSLSGSAAGGFLISSIGYGNVFLISGGILAVSFILGLSQKGRDREHVSLHPKSKKIGGQNGILSRETYVHTRDMIFKPPIMLLAIMVAFAFFFASIGSIYLPLYLRETIGFDESRIGIIIAIVAMSWAIWQLIAGKILERLRIGYGIGIGFVAMGISTYAISAFREFSQLAISGASWTAGRAFFDQSASMHMDKIFKTKKGLGSAVIEISSNIGSLLASVGGGMLIASFGYGNLLAASAACLLAGSLFGLIARKDNGKATTEHKQDK